jgi:leader peptidase (prepilin peptidase)/N-methyltransferase
MVVLWVVIFFVFGAAIGSFLNVVADRLPAGKSIISPPSHCPECQRGIPARDNIPVFSYLWLRGHCRNCGAAIPMRLFWVELGVGLLFAFLYWHYGFAWELALVAFYCCLFVILLVTDLEHGIIPNKIVYPGIGLALVVATTGSIFGFVPGDIVGPGSRLWIVNAAIGGAIFFGFLLIVVIASRGGLGWGDVKLAGLVGLVTGFPLVLVAMFLAFVGGGLIAVTLLLFKAKTRKDAIPFGPFISLAAMATLFWGQDILRFFLHS